jgi:hypothetical protein
MNTNRPNQGGQQQQQQQADDQSNTIKDPNEWTTGDEPMTGAQRSYLKTLSDEAKEEFDDTLSKAEASKRIDELQEKTGRGRLTAPRANDLVVVFKIPGRSAAR